MTTRSNSIKSNEEGKEDKTSKLRKQILYVHMFLFTLLKSTFSHFKNKAFLKHICSHCFHMFYSNYYNPSVAQLAIITINDFKEQATCSNVYPHKYNRICIYIYNINIYIYVYIYTRGMRYTDSIYNMNISLRSTTKGQTRMPT